MSYTYLFFRPARLPLATEELSEHTVLPFPDAHELRACLERHFPGLEWESPEWGRADVDGRWLELSVGEDAGGASLSIRCSHRADYGDIIQRLCDSHGWLAFDETPTCYQPHHPPMPA
ncbi:MAG TPA: hypothetical protein VFS05_15865 [Gemmatimonadaceae bacterium]|nr:hypothetical protein [Gemmatimonadaceae bacterium]